MYSWTPGKPNTPSSILHVPHPHICVGAQKCVWVSCLVVWVFVHRSYMGLMCGKSCVACASHISSGRSVGLVCLWMRWINTDGRFCKLQSIFWNIYSYICVGSTNRSRLFVCVWQSKYAPNKYVDWFIIASQFLYPIFEFTWIFHMLNQWRVSLFLF